VLNGQTLCSVAAAVESFPALKASTSSKLSRENFKARANGFAREQSAEHAQPPASTAPPVGSIAARRASYLSVARGDSSAGGTR